MRALHWFRNDLRIHDHRVLSTIHEHADTLLCVFVLDPRWFAATPLGFPKTGEHRRRFLYETLTDLDQELRGHGQRLLVVEGVPSEVLPRLVSDYSITNVFCSREVTTEEVDDEEQVIASITPIPVHRFWDRTLIHPDDLPFQLADLPDVFTQFRTKVERPWKVRALHPTAIQLPPPPELLEDDAERALPTYAPSTPSALSAFPFRGGPISGIARMDDYIHGRQLIRTYKDTRNGLLGETYSSKLSPWLATGSLSPGMIYHAVRHHEAQYGANDSTYWLLFELLWRDFFRFTAAKHGAHLFHRWSLRGTGPTWVHDRDLFQRWCVGATGDDFVDANMRELHATGWMSNRGRQNVASCLSKTLGIDWRWGAAWFESQLIDYDPCSNYGNWAYVAGVGNDPRGAYRVFNTSKQAEQYDPDGSFRRAWNSSPA